MGDLISDALSTIMNAEKVNKKECFVKRSSKLLIELLKIIKTKGYINDYRIVSKVKGGVLISLKGGINKIGSIRPRLPCKLMEFENYEKVFLPSSTFGLLIVSTPKGLMTHEQAKSKGIGGSLIAYVY